MVDCVFQDFYAHDMHAMVHGVGRKFDFGFAIKPH